LEELSIDLEKGDQSETGRKVHQALNCWGQSRINLLTWLIRSFSKRAVLGQRTARFHWKR
jgi:hypothetical protein